METSAFHIDATAGPIAEMDRLGDEIAELSAHLNAATARWLNLIREFDARGGWANGFRSCAHWLAWRVRLNLGAAREHVRVARALGSLPRLADALACGELSYSTVRALTRVATLETEERLLAVGKAGTACQVERIVRGWRRVDQIAEARETAQRHKSRGLHVYEDEDGMVVIRGRLTAEAGAVLRQALDAARETLYQRARCTGPAGSLEDVPAETPSMTQRQADALALLAETALNHGIDPGAPGDRYQVVVHVDAEVLADPEAPGQSVLEGGTHVSAETSRRLACDASRVVMRHDPEWNDSRTAGYGSGDRMGDLCPMFRLRWRSPTIPSGHSERATKRRAFTCTRGRRARAGWGSISTWVGLSTSSTRGPSGPRRSASKPSTLLRRSAVS